MESRLYAHRLGRAYGPDSSRRALAATLRGAVDGLETDVCLTADDELVRIDGATLEVRFFWIRSSTPSSSFR